MASTPESSATSGGSTTLMLFSFAQDAAIATKTPAAIIILNFIICIVIDLKISKSRNRVSKVQVNAIRPASPHPEKSPRTQDVPRNTP